MSQFIESIINEPITHTSLGRGVILNYSQDNNNIRLIVQFESKTATLGYPMVFSNNICTFDNAATQEAFQAEQNRILEEQRTVASITRENLVTGRNEERITRPNFHYIDWTVSYPHHIVIMKERYMYNGHGKSAAAINQVLHYNTYLDSFGRETAGGPDEEKIARELEIRKLNFIIVDDNRIIDGMVFEDRDPFEILNIQ